MNTECETVVLFLSDTRWTTDGTEPSESVGFKAQALETMIATPNLLKKFKTYGELAPVLITKDKGSYLDIEFFDGGGLTLYPKENE